MSLNFEKCNMFSLGMLLFYVMSFKDPAQFYNYQAYSLDSKAIRTIVLADLQPIYSDSLLRLLETCLSL